jgi:hypothetical protein
MPFPRAKPSPEALSKAQSKRDRILKLAKGGATPSEIAGLTHLRVAAVQEVIESEPAIEAASPSPTEQPPAAATWDVGGSAPWGSAAVPRDTSHLPPTPSPADIEPSIQPPMQPPPRWPMEPDVRWTPARPPTEPVSMPYDAPGSGLADTLRRILFASGVKPSVAEGVLMAYTTTPMNSLGELESILTTAGVPPQNRRFACDLWRRQVLDGSDSDGEPQFGLGASTATNPAIAAQKEALELKRIQVQSAQLDAALRFAQQGGAPVYASPSGHAAPDPRVALLEAQNRELKEDIRRREDRENFSKLISDSEARTAAKIDSLASGSTLTEERVRVQSQARLMTTLNDKIQGGAGLQGLVKSVIDSPETTKTVLDRVRRFGGDDGLGERAVGDVPDVSVEMLSRQLEQLEAASKRGPSRARPEQGAPPATAEQEQPQRGYDSG